ncbi:ABC transporter substrate-binding protein [Streptomyces mobaraensis NBRC 13819 = DSM 40847]|uniref:ABC transporter substrate-binding protein n=2 Tax=Streptomyces mobaraensis TaxID=35621 RepID=A0A5N5WBY5_STRMB|nr:ABC transporter substrate-binding protein [Streptomyces mobaraensis]EMF01652.1 glycine/betaine ABC transporter substrate-binding protein [Streptomyces mobaraensis NBRC 13819 = DSM 40847]KAB7847801.1 ABC transporter substrate-binding protein [Streptomyces mobaraensis]QTT75028.1 ABC transporter substrate-binding protein [Streptomyces mobaraensis NBRC 13819 = DSM 40847]
MTSTTPRRARTARAALAAAGVAALTAGLAACGGDSLEKSGGGDGGSSASGRGSLVIGSASFTESKVLAEIYAGLLKDAGYSTSIKTVDARELYEPALEKGQIDVVPEYAATLAEFLNKKQNGKDAPQVASADSDTTVKALRKLAEPRGLKVLDAGRAVDQNAFAVSAEFAGKHQLKTLSDLGASKESVKLAAGDECTERPFCKPGLEKTYGIRVAGIDPLEVGSTQAKQAVKNGKDQMVLTTTTDATLEQFGLVVLKDDKKLQNSDNVLPVVNARKAGSPQVVEALGKLNKVLTTEDLTELNKKVDAERLKPADVAAQYLKDKGLLGK